MEMVVNCNNVVEEDSKGSCNNHGKAEKLKDFSGECSSSCVFMASEMTSNDEISSSDYSCSTNCVSSEEMAKTNPDKIKLQKLGQSSLSESEMMRDRFSKLLLGEDMSGYGNGVCSALAISNAITNLCATIFGQIWRLQPLKPEKKLMWRREIEWFLCVSDHIVELIPTWQTFPDGSELEVMTSRPRSDLYINLPALRKLDNMLLQILDSFEDSEFWYVDQGIEPLPSQEDKWWLPVPRLPPGGLSEDSRKTLQHRRDCTNQILKAAMATNGSVVAEMDIPNSYLEALPKNAKTSLGDLIHRYINSDQFSPECLLDCLDLSSDHHALEIANRVEASIYIWRRKTNSRLTKWEMVKDFVGDADKTEQLADRAEDLLLCLKQRFPGLPQTTLDTSKIRYNKDIGKSILESYSRVLESVAFNIVARIDDLFYVDDLSKHSDQLVSISKVGIMASKSVGIAVPISGTSPYYTTPGYSPLKVISPANVDMSSPYIESSKHSLHGFGWKRLLNTSSSDSFES